jgi:ribosomal protein S18 acetylase RimI-like enzyme
MHAPGTAETLAQMIELRPLSVDDLSAARYIHTASFAGAAQEHYAPAEIDAFVAFVRSPHYADLLLGNRTVAAWVGAEMVGTAAWSPGEGLSPTARILAVFVRPLFTGEGIGRRLVDHIESEAGAAGYCAFELSATLNAVGFFEGLGYRILRNGGWALPFGRDIPVAFMRKAQFAGLHAVR